MLLLMDNCVCEPKPTKKNSIYCVNIFIVPLQGFSSAWTLSMPLIFTSTSHDSGKPSRYRVSCLPESSSNVWGILSESFSLLLPRLPPHVLLLLVLRLLLPLGVLMGPRVIRGPRPAGIKMSWCFDCPAISMDSLVLRTSAKGPDCVPAWICFCPTRSGLVALLLFGGGIKDAER